MNEATRSGPFRLQFEERLEREVAPGTQLDAVVTAWEKRISTDRADDEVAISDHADALHSLYLDLQPAAGAPASARPMTEWNPDVLWGYPRITDRQSTYVLPSPQLEDSIANYLRLGVHLPQLDAILLNAALYKTTLTAAYRLGMGPAAWWRRSVRGIVDDYGGRSLPLDVGKLVANQHSAGSGFWAIVSLLSLAPLFLLDLTTALAAAVPLSVLCTIGWHVVRIADAANSPARIAEVMLHTCVLSSGLPFHRDVASRYTETLHFEPAASAHAIRQRMYQAENLGADWPGVAYLLVQRLIQAGR